MVGIVAKAAAVAAGSVGVAVLGLALVGVADASEAGGGALRDRICAADPADVAAQQEARRTENVTAVAAELGIDPAELQSAIEVVALDNLDERLASAVEAGRLTPGEADEFRAAAAAGALRELLDARHPGAGRTRLERIQDRVC